MPTKGIVWTYLLLVIFSSGCNVVLPTCGPSQLWPRYISQQALQAHDQTYGFCCRNTLPSHGDPKSDFRLGFHDGYVESLTARLGTPPGPCTLRGWEWVERGRSQPMTACYDQGYAQGLAAGGTAIAAGLK